MENILVQNNHLGFVGRRFLSVNELYGNDDDTSISSLDVGVYSCDNLGHLEYCTFENISCMHEACIVPNVILNNEMINSSYIVFKILHS